MSLIQHNNHIHNFKHFYSSSIFQFTLIQSIKTKGKSEPSKLNQHFPLC